MYQDYRHNKQTILQHIKIDPNSCMYNMHNIVYGLWKFGNLYAFFIYYLSTNRFNYICVNNSPYSYTSFYFICVKYIEHIIIILISKLNNIRFCSDEIITYSGNSDVVLMELDLSSLNSVRQFAAKVNKQESRLDVLVNNAGVANTFGKKVTEDGLELTMATNQYGPFLLTHLLLRKNA